MAKLQHLALLVLVGAFCYIIVRLSQTSFVSQVPMRPFPLPKYYPSTTVNTLINANNNYYSCDIVELKQFDYLTRNYATKFASKTYVPLWEDYKHSVVTYCERGRNGVIIVIDELKREKATHGGSSFQIKAVSSSLFETCSFNDYFNGTYVVFCFLDRTECSNITIHLMYVDYMAYTAKTHPRNKLLWKESMCAAKCNMTMSAKMTMWHGLHLGTLQKRVELQNRVMWKSINGTMKLFVRDQSNIKWRHYQKANESQLCRWVFIHNHSVGTFGNFWIV